MCIRDRVETSQRDILQNGEVFLNQSKQVLTDFIPTVTFTVETLVGGIKLEDDDGLLLEVTANTVNVNSTANNEFFETSKSGFIDFSELNPFSEGTDW